MKHLFQAAILTGVGLLLGIPACAQRGGGARGGGGGSSSHGGGQSGAHPSGHFSGGAPGRVSTGRVSSGSGASFGGRGAVVRSGARPSGVPQMLIPPAGHTNGGLRMNVPFVPVRGNGFIARRPIFIPRIFSPFGIRHRFLFRDRFLFRNRFFAGPFFGGWFGFPFCPQFGFWSQEFFFANQLNCWGDPFFFARGFNTFGFPYGPEAYPAGYYAPQPYADAMAEDARATGAGTKTETSPTTADEQPVTWLQTVDGEIYGLTDYWVEDGRLHYVTDYGAKNALPFERIDFDKTVQLNARQGVEFVLRPKPAPQE